MAEPVKRAPRKRAPRKAAAVVVPEVEVFDPAYEAHKARVAGQTWRDVAEAYGYASATAAQLAVRNYLTRAAVAMDKSQRDEALQLELDRLDALQAAWWPAAARPWSIGPDGDPVGPDEKAANVVLNVMRQRSKLLGLEGQETEDRGVRTIVVAASPGEYLAGLKQAIEASPQPAH